MNFFETLARKHHLFCCFGYKYTYNGWLGFVELAMGGLLVKTKCVMVSSSVDQDNKDKAASYSKIIELSKKPFRRANLEN
jgi:hypothetical protein